MVMSLSGHQVAVAYDGTRGLEIAREFAPDVVLCDIGLPGKLDGYAVAQAMRRDFDFSSVFLIATTGYGQEQDRRKSRSAGFDAHLTKPVDPAELQRVLAMVSSRLVAN
jgi:CheY-like chemotaxis protein